MDQTAQTDQVPNNFTNVNFYYSFLHLLPLPSPSSTPVFFCFSGDLGQLRLELSLTICALSAFYRFTPGQNTKNDYHFSDTLAPGLGFQWLLLSSMHCFNFSSCFVCLAMPIEILKQPLTLQKYLSFCDINDPAGRQWELAAFVLTSHLHRVQMDKKELCWTWCIYTAQMTTSHPHLSPVPSAKFVSILAHVNCK